MFSSLPSSHRPCPRSVVNLFYTMIGRDREVDKLKRWARRFVVGCFESKVLGGRVFLCLEIAGLYFAITRARSSYSLFLGGGTFGSLEGDETVPSPNRAHICKEGTRHIFVVSFVDPDCLTLLPPQLPERYFDG